MHEYKKGRSLLIGLFAEYWSGRSGSDIRPLAPMHVRYRIKQTVLKLAAPADLRLSAAPHPES
ncbi:MAG: hypothetical protein JKY58_14135 [Pseudomonas sp.]|nr:hypothetical protein [Pseudomonas sp.]